MRRPRTTLLAGLAGLAGAVLLGMFWKELPALRRYIKIKQM
ncbi:DUF6893 family small protein [Nonomuraea sp. NPDC050227]